MGVAAGVSTTTASPVPGPAPEGPLAEPHQLQLACRPGAVSFGPTRKPACAFPSMSLNCTVTLTRGKPRAGRLPTQMAPGKFRAAGVAHGGVTPRIWLCSMRPVKVSYTIALVTRHEPELLRIVLPTMFTSPVAVTGCVGDGRNPALGPTTMDPARPSG